MYHNDPPLPPPVMHDRPTEDDFVCPPLPPPPTEEDLLEVASNSSHSHSSSDFVTTPTSSYKPVITPTFKANSSKFNAWTPSQNFSSTNGTEVEAKGIKSWKAPTNENTPAGFRRVAKPTAKKPEKGPESVTTTTTSKFSFPEGQQFPAASDTVKVTPEVHLPEGAVYETQTVEGDVLHTDTYYPAPGGGKMVFERTKKTTVIKAEHHEGMGPTSKEGIPVALRSSVENQKAWYKNMFKQIHKVEDEEEEQESPAINVEREREIRPVAKSVPKPKKVGKITDYTPSAPYVVENQPPTETTIPSASTGYQALKEDVKPPTTKTDLPIHGTDYSKVPDYNMADYVVSEPKKPAPAQPVKPKQVAKGNEMRVPAQVKFDFAAQSERQLSLKKGHIVMITREINNDWYEGESPDGKHSGIFPVSYVKKVQQGAKSPTKKGSAKAKFDFKGSSPKQLTVKKGDVIELIEKVDKNWYKGYLNSKTGILPANYLEILKEPESPAQPSNVSVNHHVQKQSQLKPDISHKPSLSVSSTGSDPDEKDKMVRASFLANSVVNSAPQLHHAVPKKGEYDIPELEEEAMGIKRENDLSNVQHSPQDSYNTTSSLHSDMNQKLHIFTPEPPRALVAPVVTKEAPQHQILPSPKLSEQNTIQSPIEDVLPPMYKHVALYPYVPQNEDELELVGGDIVQVIEKCDDGWFVGTCERTGAFGTFPGNYVISVD